MHIPRQAADVNGEESLTCKPKKSRHWRDRRKALNNCRFVQALSCLLCKTWTICLRWLLARGSRAGRAERLPT